MIRFPTSAAGAAEALVATDAAGTARAGGTDLQERLALGIAPREIVDLRDVAGLDAIAAEGKGFRIGAKVRIAELGAHPGIVASHAGLAEAAAGLATPQIRAVATVGGNLLQRVRCWYYRNPDARCLKKGGESCLARAGDHLHHACIDLGPCVAPHPSTLGAALLAYDARVSIATRDGKTEERTVAALMGDGGDPIRENTLGAGELLTGVLLPAALPGERAAYVRAISRARAEWPLVEAVARLGLAGGKVTSAAVAVGGVATVPLRRAKVEEALVDRTPTPEVLARAAALASDGADPLPMTGYKVRLLEATVLEALERATAKG